VKYLKLLPFGLFGINLILIKSIPTMIIEINVITALIIIIISIYLLYKLINDVNQKNKN